MVHVLEKKWFVLTTKSRQEKKATETLKSEGFNVYCPLQNVKRTWSDRTKIIKEPLFYGYVFIHLEVHTIERIFTFITAVRYLFWLNKLVLVRTTKIESIRKWLIHFEHEFIQVEQKERGFLVQLNISPFIEQKALLIDYG